MNKYTIEILEDSYGNYKLIFLKNGAVVKISETAHKYGLSDVSMCNIVAALEEMGIIE